MPHRTWRILFAAAVAAATAAAPAADLPAPTADPSAGADTLGGRIEDAKGEALHLNRDLLLLEEELLFPAGTQVALFVSMEVGKPFALASVQVRLDDKLVASHVYTPLEVEALQRGGVQRLYLGNLRSGAHELAASFTGKGPQEREHRRDASLRFEKGREPRYIELRIKDPAGKLQPEFEIKLWQ